MNTFDESLPEFEEDDFTPSFAELAHENEGMFEHSNDNLIDNTDAYNHFFEKQRYSNNCAIETVRTIYGVFSGTYISQDASLQWASQKGYYDSASGTDMYSISPMLTDIGIENHEVIGATSSDLANELSQGHAVVVCVDSDELWDTGLMAELKLWLSKHFGIDFGDSSANHAVIVTGLDLRDPDNPLVILNDSGSDNGPGQPYPLDKFVEAWQDSNCYYVASTAPLPDKCIQGDLSTLATYADTTEDPSAFTGAEPEGEDTEINPLLLDALNNDNNIVII